MLYFDRYEDRHSFHLQVYEKVYRVVKCIYAYGVLFFFFNFRKPGGKCRVGQSTLTIVDGKSPSTYFLETKNISFSSFCARRVYQNENNLNNKSKIFFQLFYKNKFFLLPKPKVPSFGPHLRPGITTFMACSNCSALWWTTRNFKFVTFKIILND